MLEAPEAALIARQLNDTIGGKRIVLAEAAHTAHKFAFFNGEPSLYEEKLKGNTIGECRNYGGLVEIEIGDMCLLLGDGANLTFIPSTDYIPSKHQLLIGFDDNTALTISVRMYAFLWLYEKDNITGNITEYYNAARLKPQVLSDDFTEEYFRGLISDISVQKKSAKAFLATEQTIPGLGNGVLQDILYNACIHPKTKISALSDSQKDKLYKCVKATLTDMYEKSGRNCETDLFGRQGKYVPHLSKETEGFNCGRCGGIILKENYLGGSIYYCTGCQLL